MIEKILIRDFQAHAKLEVVCDPRVTTIVGRSDAGKSAVLRALRWLATNKPGGDGFIRYGAERCEVVVIADGVRIARERGKGRNTYKIGGKRLAAFGADVPAAVSAKLNVSDVNFQAQHDAPWWFAASAGEVSRQLNEIINLGAIDRTLSFLNTKLRESNAAAAAARARLGAARDKAAAAKPALDAKADFDALDALRARAAAAAGAAAGLLGAIEDAADGRGAAENAAQRHDAAKAVLVAGLAWHAGQDTALADAIAAAKQAAKLAGDAKSAMVLYQDRWTQALGDAPCPLCGRVKDRATS